MARYNEILVGRYNRLLQKLLSMKGGAPAPQLASEIGASFVLFSGAENRYLESYEKFGLAVGTVGPTAGNTSCVRFRLPAGSNIVVVFELLAIWVGTADANVTVSKSAGVTTDLAGVSASVNSNFDDRGRTAPTLVISNQSSTAAAPILGATQRAIWQASQPANTLAQVITTDIQEAPLLPGSGWQINAGAVNESLGVTVWWRERFLEESERT